MTGLSTIRRAAFGLAATLAVGAVAPAADAAEKVTWRFSTYGPPRPFTTGMEHFAKMAKEKSGGNFEIRIYYNEQLSDAKDFLDGIKLDAFQAAAVAFSYAPGKTPLQSVLDMPYLPIPDLVSQEKVHEAFHSWGPAKEELARWNATAHFVLLLPQYEFMGVGKAPRAIDDWKGMRVRALGGLGEAMKLLGSIPTSVPAPEVYTALERGVFQAASFPFAYSFGTYKLHEVSKWYTSGLQLGIVHNAIVFNLPAWNKLPAEYQKILIDAKPAAYKAMRDAYAEADAKWIPLFEKRLDRIAISPQMLAEIQEVAGRPVWQKWVEETEAKGLPGKQALELVLDEARKAGGG